MPIVLYRVDERLIHGQVMIGWGERLRPDRYLVIDEEVATTSWEQELYRLSAGGDTDLLFSGLEGARRDLRSWQGDPRRSILLTRDIQTMLGLARGGLLRGESVNLGGIHHAEGRIKVKPYLYLGLDERHGIRALEAEGVSVTAMDVPGSTRVTSASLLEGA